MAIDLDAIEREVAAYRKAMTAFQETLEQELTDDGSEQREHLLRSLAQTMNVHHSLLSLTSGGGLVMQVTVSFSPVVEDAAALLTTILAAREPAS
jgi:hypothetical protein